MFLPGGMKRLEKQTIEVIYAIASPNERKRGDRLFFQQPESMFYNTFSFSSKRKRKSFFSKQVGRDNTDIMSWYALLHKYTIPCGKATIEIPA